MAKPTRAYVYKISGLLGIDEYKVYPPVVILSKGETFQLVNMVDDHDAELSVPSGVFEDGAVKEKIKGKGGHSKEQTAKETTIVATYKVDVDGKHATAHSDPIIIIDP
jgi:hypothetical protein